METIKTSLRSDKRVTPTIKEYALLSYEECRNLSGHALILDRNRKVAQVKITKVKTWKTRSDVEIHCKFGLYEFFNITITPNNPNTELVKEVE